MTDRTRELLTASALVARGADDHAEIIGGELVLETMTRYEHGDAQLSIGSELKVRFRGGGPGGDDGWWIATEVTVEYEAHQVFRHDLVGWRKARVPERPQGFPVSTRPDWACEVLSRDRRKDLVEKREVLHRHHVDHYWLVDLDSLLLTVLRHHDDGYLIAHTLSPGTSARIEPFDAVELEVARLFGDLE